MWSDESRFTRLSRGMEGRELLMDPSCLVPTEAAPCGPSCVHRTRSDDQNQQVGPHFFDDLWDALENTQHSSPTFQSLIHDPEVKSGQLRTEINAG